jgi:hypothetical protein
MQVKFRGKAVIDGTWVIGDLHQEGEDVMYIFPHTPNELDSPELYIIDPKSLGMFVGLHDIRGNEIYGGIGTKGGDIIDYSDMNKDESFYYLVEWGNQGFIPEEFPLEDSLVVGNCEDNSELLEQ